MSWMVLPSTGTCTYLVRVQIKPNLTWNNLIRVVVKLWPEVKRMGVKRGKKTQSGGENEGEDKGEDQLLHGGADEAVISQFYCILQSKLQCEKHKQQQQQKPLLNHNPHRLKKVATSATFSLGRSSSYLLFNTLQRGNLIISIWVKSIWAPTSDLCTYPGVHSAAFVSGCTDFFQSDAEYPEVPEQFHTQCHLWALEPGHPGCCKTVSAGKS